MTFYTFKKLRMGALLFFLPFTTFAWGVEGHRVVAQVAESYLSKKAKKEIGKILGPESMAMVSNWADFVKSDPSYNYLYSWHYINLKPGLSASEVEDYLDKDTATDVYTKINLCTTALKSAGGSAEDKIFYLKLLIHLVGDIHQPLHTGRAEDQGGNKVKVFWFSEPKNLHQVWDEQLVMFQQLSYTEYTAAINHCTEAERTGWQHEPVSAWVYESYQLSEKIYSDINQQDQKLDYKYNFNNVAALNRQLLKGGVRLAGLLNAIFR